MTALTTSRTSVTGRSPWWIALGAMLALVVGNGPVMQFTFGVFLKPVATEFHMERGLGSAAMMAGLLVTAFCMPLAGRLVDRFGSRRLALFAICGFSLAMIATGMLARGFMSFAALYAIAGVFGAGHSPLPYVRSVSQNFDRNRGLALALSLTGVGLGTMLMPLAAQQLVNVVGWRGGFVGLGAMVAIIALPAVLAFLPADRPPEREFSGKVSGSGQHLNGLTVTEALRSRQFWVLMLALFLAAAAINGTIAHVVPMLTDKKIPQEMAVSAVAWVGISSIIGRLLGGYLIDRHWAPRVAAVFFGGTTGGILLLVVSSSAALASAGVCLLGLGLGLEADMVGFMLSRYFGTRSFGTLFGYTFGSFLLASSIGPILMGVSYDQTGSYVSCMLLFCGMVVISAALLLSLGRYRFPAAH